MLHEELSDSDIPHWTTLQNQLSEVFTEYLDTLRDEMKVLIYLLVDLNDESHNMSLQASSGKISCTTNIWSDINLRPFLAVTAHWIQCVFESSLSGPKSELKL